MLEILEMNYTAWRIQGGAMGAQSPRNHRIQAPMGAEPYLE